MTVVSSSGVKFGLVRGGLVLAAAAAGGVIVPVAIDGGSWYWNPLVGAAVDAAPIMPASAAIIAIGSGGADGWLDTGTAADDEKEGEIALGGGCVSGGSGAGVPPAAPPNTLASSWTKNSCNILLEWLFGGVATTGGAVGT